jgi:hypothetical protein
VALGLKGIDNEERLILACSEAIEPLGRMAAAWNLPILGLSGADFALNDKEIYTTLTRLAYSFDQLADFYINVFSRFHWTDVTVLYDGDGTRFRKLVYILNTSIGVNMHRAFDKAGLRSTLLQFASESDDDQGYVGTLRKGKSSSRGM